MSTMANTQKGIDLYVIMNYDLSLAYCILVHGEPTTFYYYLYLHNINIKYICTSVAYVIIMSVERIANTWNFLCLWIEV